MFKGTWYDVYSASVQKFDQIVHKWMVLAALEALEDFIACCKANNTKLLGVLKNEKFYLS